MLQTFYDRNLLVYKKLEFLSLASLSSLVYCLRVMPEPTRVKQHAREAYERVGSLPYPQTFNKGQTLKLFTSFHKLWL